MEVKYERLTPDSHGVISCAAWGGRLNARQEESVHFAAAAKVETPVLYANKIAGHARTAGNANQRAPLCKQQLNVWL